MSDYFDFHSQYSYYNDFDNGDINIISNPQESDFQSPNRIVLTEEPIFQKEFPEKENQLISTVVRNGHYMIPNEEIMEPVGELFDESINNNQVINSDSEEEELDLQIFPKETKNIYKNWCNGFQKFIMETTPKLRREDIYVDQLLRLKARDRCFDRLKKLISKSPKLKQLAAFYFGQFAWSKNFLKSNKVHLDSFLRFNKIMYKRRNNRKKIQ